MAKSFVCCICGEDSMGYGNNPYPVVKDKDAVCCDRCNLTKVIPERMRIAREDNEADDKE